MFTDIEVDTWLRSNPQKVQDHLSTEPRYVIEWWLAESRARDGGGLDKYLDGIRSHVRFQQNRRALVLDGMHDNSSLDELNDWIKKDVRRFNLITRWNTYGYNYSDQDKQELFAIRDNMLTTLNHKDILTPLEEVPEPLRKVNTAIKLEYGGVVRYINLFEQWRDEYTSEVAAFQAKHGSKSP